MKKLTILGIEIPSDLKFFILEDTEVYQNKIITDLENAGFNGEMIVTATLAEARSQLSKEKPGLILCDWNLPDGKGIDLLKTVRTSKSYDDVAFVMVTTMDAIDDIINAIEGGSDDYAVKPWEDADLIKKIVQAYDKRIKLSPL